MSWIWDQLVLELGLAFASSELACVYGILTDSPLTWIHSLESALRNFSCLTKGDIIGITYNMLTFDFEIKEIVPEGPGISIIDTDLEVSLHNFDTWFAVCLMMSDFPLVYTMRLD